MLTLDTAALSPYAGESVPYSAIASASSITPAASVSLGSSSLQQATLAIATGGSELQTFDLPAGTAKVDRVLYGTETFSPAVDPTDPQPGEFVFNSLTQQVTVNPLSPLVTGRSLVAQSADSSNVLVDYLLNTDALPDIFSKYNVTGALAWSCDWEGNPRGAFELITDWATADALEGELIPQKTELEIYGIGFQVASLTITKRSPLENPTLEARVNVELRGKWEAKLEEQVVIDSVNGTSGGARTIRGDTTVQEIAAKVGAVANLPKNRIRAPIKAGEEEIGNLQEFFEANLRHNGCFARYSSAGAIEAVSLNAVPTHQISYGDLMNQALEIQVNASPRAFDYKNGRLEWGERAGVPSTLGEDTQGNAAQLLSPQWRQKPPDRQMFTVGSPNPTVPPSDLVTAVDSSLVFDNGGPVKESTTTTTENGAIVQQQYRKYGIVAVACDHLYVRTTVNGKTGWYLAGTSALARWQLIEFWQSFYAYDQNGYLTGIRISGQRLGRLKSEGNNESLEAYDKWSRAGAGNTKQKLLKKLDAYRFSWTPLYEANAFAAAKFRNHYRDIPPPTTEEAELFFPEFQGDGNIRTPVFVSSAYGPVVTTREEVNGQPWIRLKYQAPVPGYVDPRFCTTELGRKSCFMRAADPDSKPQKPLPDMTTGEDKESERRLFVPDYRSSRVSEGSETYVEYNRLQTQKDAGFSRSARETTEEQSKGRPSEHTRKEDLYEKIDPEEGEGEGDEYEYIISTADHEDDRIVGETASYPYASNQDQAMVGLRTDLEIINTRDTKNTSLELKHALATREGDLLNLEGHGLWRVLSYSKSLVIMGPGLIQPGPMTLELGKRISGDAIAITLTKRLKPKPPDEREEEANSLSEADSGILISGRISRGNSG